AIRGGATLGIDYDPHAGGTASDVFYSGKANCLSYASLLVAMAREAGLDASYQWLYLRPQWTRSGERVMVRLHVNVDVDLRGGERFMADIDPLSPAQVTGSRLMDDSDAEALHHSNIAMLALADGDVGEAWLNGVRALQLSPGMPHLWVNLGAVYRASGQFEAAEQSYLQALALDLREQSAMNNLVILYDMDGRPDERAQWLERVASYRDANPYYHAWLGDEASGAGLWSEALGHYEKAVALSGGDSRLLYSLGQAHWQVGDQVAASQYLEQAIESASLVSEINVYRAQLEAWRRESQTSSVFAES
ncbi:MAG: tetratricopeptide repeat protein, partial [Halioglobus sp.]